MLGPRSHLRLLVADALARIFEARLLSLRVQRLPFVRLSKALEALELARQLCHALATAHDAGIVHRDLKPENVLLDETPNGLEPKLADFGIASLAVTATGHVGTANVIGTPQYLAPELGDGQPSGRAGDLYALGAKPLRAAKSWVLRNARAVTVMNQDMRDKAIELGVPVLDEDGFVWFLKDGPATENTP